MRRLATMFLLIVTFGMVFAGAVSAQEVTTTVIDEDGNPATTVCNGDSVTIDIVAENTGTTNITEPYVNLSVLKNSSLVIDPTTAVMTYTFTNGSTITYTNSATNPILYWSDYWQFWWWNILWVVPSMQPGESATLDVNALVKETGKITVTSNFYQFPFVLQDSSTYTFTSVPCHNCHPQQQRTVPMQNTGAPITVAMLGLLGIIGGTIYSRLR
jgi:hypothetical protein